MSAARSQVFHCTMSVNRSDGAHHRNGEYVSGQVSGVSLYVSVNRSDGAHHRNGKYGSGQVSDVSL